MDTLITITNVAADADPAVRICTCTVQQDTGGTETGVLYSFVPDDPMRSAFGQQVANWLVDHQGQYTVQPYTPPASLPYRIAKSTPWLRMTDDEAELITGAMQQAPSRQKGIYDAATYLSSDDPLWGALHDMIATTLNSSSRADELLAPET